MRLHRSQRGFTLLELVIIVLILGIIWSILLPAFLSSLQKAKQRRTMANTAAVGKAMMNWLTDQFGAAAAGAGAGVYDFGDYPPPIDTEAVRDLLVPNYVAHVPEIDAWGGAYEYRMRADSLKSAGLLAIRSPALDKVFSGDVYTAAPFLTTDYDQDIVWADGLFVRWPQAWRQN